MNLGDNNNLMYQMFSFLESMNMQFEYKSVLQGLA